MQMLKELGPVTLLSFLAGTLFVVGVAMTCILSLCNRWLGKWACRVLGWHLAPGQQGFDGCSFNGECPRCGEFVMQDSQGNWF